MSTPYELTGRSRQKQRTRDALVEAAKGMVARGVSPSVADAAEQAGVSRTSAYRYFPSQRSLLMAAHPETATSSLLPADPPADASARLEAVIAAFTELILKTEAQQRTMLRLSLEADAAERERLPLRQGRAIGWITEALQPLEGSLDQEQLRRLVLAIRSATGIEARVWLTDVAGLSPAAATDLMRWSAQALLRAALADRPDLPGNDEPPGADHRRHPVGVEGD